MNPEIKAESPFKHLMADPYKDGPKAKNNMGKEDFMRLLLAQLQHQDPLKPMDHQEFVAQLAQFSSLEQLTNIGGGIQNVRAGLDEGAKLNALSMIGRRAITGANEIDHREGQPTPLRYVAQNDVRPVKATITGPGGEVVRELDLQGKTLGSEVIWDGKDQYGRNAQSGRYTYRVAGLDLKGQPHEYSTDITGTVTGVDISSAVPIALIKSETGAISRIELSKIRHVEVDAEAKPQPMARPPLSFTPRSIPVIQDLQADQAEPEQEVSDEDRMPGMGERFEDLVGSSAQGPFGGFRR